MIIKIVDNHIDSAIPTVRRISGTSERRNEKISIFRTSCQPVGPSVGPVIQSRPVND